MASHFMTLCYKSERHICTMTYIRQMSKYRIPTQYDTKLTKQIFWRIKTFLYHYLITINSITISPNNTSHSKDNTICYFYKNEQFTHRTISYCKCSKLLSSLLDVIAEYYLPFILFCEEYDYCQQHQINPKLISQSHRQRIYFGIHSILAQIAESAIVHIFPYNFVRKKNHFHWIFYYSKIILDGFLYYIWIYCYSKIILDGCFYYIWIYC